MSRPVSRIGLVAALVVAAAASGCGGGGSTKMPEGAKTCEQLVKGAAQLTRSIVTGLQGKTEADLRAANPNEPFAELMQPYDGYRARAAELGCDDGELVRLACTEYQDIEPNGPVAEEFLGLVSDTCR